MKQIPQKNSECWHMIFGLSFWVYAFGIPTADSTFLTYIYIESE